MKKATIIKLPSNYVLLIDGEIHTPAQHTEWRNRQEAIRLGAGEIEICNGLDGWKLTRTSDSEAGSSSGSSDSPSESQQEDGDGSSSASRGRGRGGNSQSQSDK